MALASLEVKFCAYIRAPVDEALGYDLTRQRGRDRRALTSLRVSVNHVESRTGERLTHSSATAKHIAAPLFKAPGISASPVASGLK